MDPAAPNYDRPPRRRRKPATQTGGRPVTPSGLSTTASAPGATTPPRQQALQRMQKPNVPFKDPRRGGFPTAYPKGFPSGAKTNNEGKKIGLFNATHKHGKPIQSLIAQLKKRRKKQPVKASYTPNASTSASPR